jgi:hypothetical protein
MAQANAKLSFSLNNNGDLLIQTSWNNRTNLGDLASLIAMVNNGAFSESILEIISETGEEKGKPEDANILRDLIEEQEKIIFETRMSGKKKVFENTIPITPATKAFGLGD